MSVQAITFVFRHGTLRVEQSIRGIVSVLERYGFSGEKFRMDGVSGGIAMLASRLERKRQDTFDIEGDRFSFSQSRVTNFDLDFLEIKMEKRQVACDGWATEIVKADSFVMGWFADVEYEYWQNASDPLQYEACGRSYTHLPQKSNRLPFPLEGMIIDTSQNPGRRILKKSYIEAVGSVMWLGMPFWNITGANREVVAKATWLNLSHPFPGVIRIQSADDCFTTGYGQSGILQEKLRNLLFPFKNIKRKP